MNVLSLEELPIRIKDTFDFVLLKKEQDVFVDRNIEDINEDYLVMVLQIFPYNV